MNISEPFRYLGVNLGDEGRASIKGNDLSYYLERLNEVRQRTYELFAAVDDDWLYTEKEFWHNKPANFYFMWFHVSKVILTVLIFDIVYYTGKEIGKLAYYMSH